MQPLTGQQRLRRDLVTGNRLLFNPALQLLILNQLNWELESEVNWQNHQLISSKAVLAKEKGMREMHDLAAGMKDAIAKLKQTAINAKIGLDSEITRANVNADKVNSLTADLSSANKEVEDFLGESGSNFPPSAASATPPVTTPLKPDINGVTLNPGTSK
jgi:hypothetical protein